MTEPTIIEVAARAIWENANGTSKIYTWEEFVEDNKYKKYYFKLATAVLAAVTPLILELAAKAAEDCAVDWNPHKYDRAIKAIVAAIRALKEQP